MFESRLFDDTVTVAGGIAVTSDGTVFWISDADEITKMTLDGVKTAYTYTPTSIGIGGGFLHVGPDDNLWTLSVDDGEVIKMTPTGTFTQYAITTPSASYSRLINGPDGNLWFTEVNNAQIAKITTGGTVTEYAVTAGHFPTGIASDGTLLWVCTIDAGGKLNIKSYDTSGVQQSTALSATSVLSGNLYISASGEFWSESSSNNSTIWRTGADAVVLSSSLPITGGSNSRYDLLRVPDGFLTVGSLLAGNEDASITKVSDGNDLLAYGPTPGNSVPRFIAYNPINNWYYVADMDSSPQSIGAFEDTTNPRLIDGDKLTENRK